MPCRLKIHQKLPAVIPSIYRSACLVFNTDSASLINKSEHFRNMATSLLVSQAAESGQRVHLHPLVLLTASDLITRHRLRQLQGPIAGILLGQQEGTQISAEYAFTAKVKDGLLDQAENWTAKRIEQCMFGPQIMDACCLPAV